MKKIKLFLISFLFLLIGGVLIQKYSGYLYQAPVGVVQTATVNETSQGATIRLINEKPKELIEITEEYDENHAMTGKLSPGDQVILAKKGNKWQIHSLKRDGYVFILIGSFLLFVLLIGGKKGGLSLLGVLCNLIFLLVLVWINKLYPKLPLTTLMIGYTILAVFLSMTTLYGFKKIDWRKTLATLASVFLAYFLCVAVMDLFHDSGLRFEEMQFVTRPYRTVFLASLLIGSIGAALDNSVMIVSSLDEIVAHRPEIENQELIQTGLRIASDTSASMVNVLLYAYVSGAAPVFLFYLANGWLFTDTFQMHLSLELLRALCGGLAIVFTVPLSLASFIFFRRTRKQEEVQQ
ncbi:MAG: YibE/F family protein [Enterococcus sp.]